MRVAGGASRFTRYAVAAGSVVVATAIRLSLDPLVGTQFPFATLFFAVLVSAWFGGFGPALLASGCGTLAAAWLLLPPRFQLVVDDPERLGGLALYLAVSLGIASIGGAMRRARGRAEAEAREAATRREELRVTLQSIGDAVITTDLQCCITSMNAVAAELTGWTVEAAAGRPLAEVFRIVDEATRQPVPDPAKRALGEGRVVALANHAVLIARDGSERPIDDSAAPIRDRRGAVSGAVLVFRDVAARRQAEERIRSSEQELTDFFENANVGLHCAGPDGIILRANRAELEMLGYARAEYVGHHIAEFHLDPDVIADILTRLAAGETLHGRPARLRCKDGSVKEVLINSSVLWDHGRFVHTRCFTLDVTDRTRAAEAQAYLAAVVESSDDAVVTKTLDGIITSWNPGAERLFGYTRAEAVGQPITLLIPPDRQDEERRVLECLRRGERIEPFDTVRVAKSGRSIDVSLRISPIRDHSGRIIGASKLARDITASRLAERALRESEERFRQLATNAPAAIFVKDLAGRYTLANPLAREALGRPDTVVGLTDHDLLPRDVADALRRADQEVIATGRATEGEEVVRRPGFDRRYLSVKFPLCDTGGTAVGVCGVAIDITDRQRAAEALSESEERFRMLADNIAQFAWMADGSGWIFWYNQRWFDYTGATLEQMEGWGWRAVHHPDHVDRVVEKISRCFRSGEVWEDTFPLRGADGTYRWFLSRAVPIRDGTGRVTRWFGTNTDVTAQREAEEALKEADRRKDEFLATLAHELRNPLAPVRHSLEIMKRAGGDGELMEQAYVTMDRQMTHLERLVDDLLDIARISRDRVTLRLEHVELTSVLSQALETCRSVAQAAGLELRVEVPRDSIWLHADAMRLAQVFSNLLHNACKYTEPGGWIGLEARRDGAAVVVTVRDTGRGISPAMLPRVFEMFTQLDQSADRAGSGLGIGLTLVQRLVELHGGRVEAFSEGVGRGSEFVVRLPLADAIGAPAAGPPPRAAAERPPARRRVLVVDDNTDAAESLATLLEISGHETALAHDGRAAIEAAEAYRPDVVLLDIGLPKLSGHEAARWIRERPWGRDVVLVALTGWGQDEDRRKSREVGFDHHLVKPVNIAALMELLATGLRRRRDPDRAAPAR
jgi:PAS domain S-box-containing protein